MSNEAHCVNVKTYFIGSPRESIQSLRTFFSRYSLQRHPHSTSGKIAWSLASEKKYFEHIIVVGDRYTQLTNMGDSFVWSLKNGELEQVRNIVEAKVKFILWNVECVVVVREKQYM